MQQWDKQQQKELASCRERLAKAQDLMDVSVCFFRLGVALSRVGQVSGAIQCFHDAFLIRDRATDFSHDVWWPDFHLVQMGVYVIGKPSKKISSLAEGDMIHDLIKCRWMELKEEKACSEIPFYCSDMRSWFHTITIDFPWDRFIKEDEDVCVIIAQ